MFWRPANVRSRLTFSYLAVVTLFIGGVYLATLGVVYSQMRNQLSQFARWQLETLDGVFFFAPDGTVRLPEELYQSDNTGVYVAVFSPEGNLLFQSKNLRGRGLGGPPVEGEGVNGFSECSTRLPGGEHVRLLSRSQLLDGRRILIRVARSEEPIRLQAVRLLKSLLVSVDRKSTRLNSSHEIPSRMPSSA